jgi:hypothetical protein
VDVSRGHDVVRAGRHGDGARDREHDASAEAAQGGVGGLLHRGLLRAVLALHDRVLLEQSALEPHGRLGRRVGHRVEDADRHLLARRGEACSVHQDFGLDGLAEPVGSALGLRAGQRHCSEANPDAQQDPEPVAERNQGSSARSLLERDLIELTALEQRETGAGPALVGADRRRVPRLHDRPLAMEEGRGSG